METQRPHFRFGKPEGEKPLFPLETLLSGVATCDSRFHADFFQLGENVHVTPEDKRDLEKSMREHFRRMVARHRETGCPDAPIVSVLDGATLTELTNLAPQARVRGRSKAPLN